MKIGVGIGLALALIGAGSNRLVSWANGGMPIAVNYAYMFPGHVNLTPSSKFGWLADRIWWAFGWLSIGDIAIAVGSLLAIACLIFYLHGKGRVKFSGGFLRRDVY